MFWIDLLKRRDNRKHRREDIPFIYLHIACMTGMRQSLSNIGNEIVLTNISRCEAESPIRSSRHIG